MTSFKLKGADTDITNSARPHSSGWRPQLPARNPPTNDVKDIKSYNTLSNGSVEMTENHTSGHDYLDLRRDTCYNEPHASMVNTGDVDTYYDDTFDPRANTGDVDTYYDDTFDHMANGANDGEESDYLEPINIR